MTKLIFLILFVPLICYGESKVFFKIAVDERAYSSFLLENLGDGQSVLHSLASRLKEKHLELDKIEKDYYNIKIEYGMKYNGLDVVQYDIAPLLPDRFRHVLLVDAKSDHILRREVYDTEGKLIYAYSFEDKNDELKPVINRPELNLFQERNQFPGFKPVFKKELHDGTMQTLYSDGLNKFSVFVKTTEHDIGESSRILYGNYVYRKKIGDSLYTVVGTIPFPQMEKVVSRLAFKEDK
jgi:sigma-E factor negative regulatory protein RseB